MKKLRLAPKTTIRQPGGGSNLSPKPVRVKVAKTSDRGGPAKNQMVPGERKLLKRDHGGGRFQPKSK